MSVYKIRFGTPEEWVPTKFAPESLLPVTELTPANARRSRQAPSREGSGYTYSRDINVLTLTDKTKSVCSYRYEIAGRVQIQ